MKKEWIVERQGRQFVLYAGLLSLAHEAGLKVVNTNLLQFPNEANNRTAVVMCTATFEKDGVEKIFTGIGDAAPNNVAPAMQNCLIRMAETRAKSRAFRDAVNVGETAFEELGDEDATDNAPERGYGSRQGTPRGPKGAQRLQPNAAGRCPECEAIAGFHKPTCSQHVAEAS